MVRRNPAPPPATAIDSQALFRKITWRLIPYLFVLYILAYLDRVNVGFAALDMQRDLHLSNTVYGTGAGIFFLGYALFDLPSNLLLARFGARRWIARIMITWGLVATGMAFISGPHSFYLLRFLLGLGEAGFFPGILLYLTFWFPSRVRAQAVAKFMTATSLAGVVGGPLSNVLLKLEGESGLHGWQWLFLSEGLPTILMGISVFYILQDKPAEASWLTQDEKLWLATELEGDRNSRGGASQHNLLDALRLPAVWMLAAVYVISQIGVYTVNLWMPLVLNTFVHRKSPDDAGHLALYSTLPYLAAAICTVFVGWSSDRTGDRRFHIAACLTTSAIGFSWAAIAHSLPAALCAFTLGTIGWWSMMGAFWALLTRLLSSRAAAGGVAIITTLGGLGGFVGPYITGRLRDLTHSFSAGLFGIGGLALFAAVLCLTMRETPVSKPEILPQSSPSS
jgi:ACS family tartrate transporter-like MFS transporter